MGKIALLLLAVSPLLGCAGSPVGDAIAGPEKLAERDDAYCRSIGAQGDAYTNCRLFMTQQRQANHNARLGMAIQSLNAATIRPSPAVICQTTPGLMGSSTTT